SRLQSILHDNPFVEASVFEKRSHFSTSLTRGAGYRDFMQIYLLLTRGLEIAQNDIFNIEQKNISTLYEYWCFLMLVKILKEQNACEIEYQDLIKIKAGKVKVELEKGRKSKVTFKNSLTNETTTIYFNREFVRDSKKIFTYNQRPDYSIEFKRHGFDKPFWYLFDAKYRFDENSRSENGVFNVPQDAIGQLHRYRDAILHTEPSTSTYRGAIKNLGGIILYPYPLGEDKFEKDNIFFKSIEDVNIGALPFLPSKTRLVNELLSSLINKTPEDHFEQFIDMDRQEYEKQRNRWKGLVTVGVIPKENQTERIKFLREKLIYHLPFVANTNSKLYMSKKLLLCVSGTNEAFQYDVHYWEILTDKELQSTGTTWFLRKEKYVAFHLMNETRILTPRNIAPLNFRYATSEGLNRYFRDPNKNEKCFYLTNSDAARLYDELQRLSMTFELNWINDKNDPSLVQFTVGEKNILSSDSFPPLNFKIADKMIHLHEVLRILSKDL
ncbi:nuclease domain-containing protein, partial [Bacteroidota bacterium]